MSKQLYRANENKVLAGVCGGVAEYFEVDPTIVRVIWFLSIFPGVGVIAYIACWLIIPERKYRSIGNNHYESGNTHYEPEKSRQILGIFLIVIGALFLMDRFFKWFDMEIVIPLGIIAIGVFVLLSTRRENK